MGTTTIQLTQVKASSGVAPLHVFFDSSGTTSSISTRPFFDLYAVWDFGDPSAGNWANGNSKNVAYGLVASHLYENPGTYNGTLSVWDYEGDLASVNFQVVVNAFTGTTRYVSSSGGNNGWPGTEAQPWQTFDYAWSQLTSNMKLLFKRGDSWSINIEASDRVLSVAGPGIIGAYGSGSKPIFNVSKDSGIERNFIVVQSSDWRLIDLDCNRVGSYWVWCGFGGSDSWKIENVLFLRCDLDGFSNSFASGSGESQTRLQDPNVNVSYIECSLRNYNILGTYIGSRTSAFQGNDFEAPYPTLNGSHLVRIYQFHKGVISNNRLYRQGQASDHVLKLHGPQSIWGPYYTQYVILSDNDIAGDSGWPIYICPQSPEHNPPIYQNDEPLSWILFERNKYHSLADIEMMIIVHVEYFEARNNLIDGTYPDVGYFYPFTIGYGGMTYTAKHIRILHNTFVGMNSGAEFYMALIGDPLTDDLLIRNNAGYAPNYTIRAIAEGTCLNYVQDHNSISTNPADFVNPSGGDFHLPAGSPHEDVAQSSTSMEDYENSTRYGVLPDRGCYERIAGELPGDGEPEPPEEPIMPPKIGKPLTGLRKTTNFF